MGLVGRAVQRLWVGIRRSGVLHPTALKVLAFAVVCLLLLAVLAARIGNISFFSQRSTYYADLSDATGLAPSDEVKIAGVTVGEVDSVTLQRAHALVAFSLDDKVQLHSGTQVGLQWHNVLGQQFLYLYPVDTGKTLKPGATLPLSDDVPGADIGALLNSLGPLLGALHPQQANEVVESFAQTLQGNETQVDQLISNAASVSSTVGSVDTQVGEVVTDLDQVIGALAQRSSDLGQVISNLQSVSSSLASRNDLLDQTVANLGTVSGEVASIEADTHGSLSTAIGDLEAVSAEIQSREGELSQGVSTLGAGLAPYVEISSYGQWFQIQAVYSCAANEKSCSYYQSSNPPAGSGTGGSPPSSAPTAGAAGGLGPLGTGGSSSGAGSSASIGQMLQMVAGEGTFLGSEP
ncbi:MAG TPA: MCE family protein [Acidimicrobiales bacterium]|nr:MCE family protein [Acidimicrobiales bacterium]